MIGRKRMVKHFCVVLVALLLLAGCAADQGARYVRRGDSTTYRVTRAGGEKVYLADGHTGDSKYVAKDGKLVRITPERPVASTKKAEVLSPLDAEFVAATTPELLTAFIDKNAPAELAFVAVQHLARPAIDGHDWPAAIEIFEKFRDKFPTHKDRLNTIIAILEAPEEELTVANLGGGVNSGAGEYSPVISSDGKMIYFARDCGECSGGEEIYASRQGDDGRWGIARIFGEPLSSMGHEIPLGISADGTTLAVYGHYGGSLGRGDIFFVEKTPEGWGALQHYSAPLNTGDFESDAMYTADGKAILFVSERPDGIGDYHEKGRSFNGNRAGNTDIYVYTDGTGAQGEVINLGPVINTPYSEHTPFLHPDGKTLYFSSDGHGGLGGLDVYKATRLNENSWTEWSKPVNLGKDINTSRNDWGYQLPAEGGITYFARSSLADSFGGSDIFSISLPEKVKPSEVLTVRGVVTDPLGDPLVAELRWDDLDGQQEVGYANSDPITGEYVIHLPSGGNYGYYADKPGYIGESEHVDLREYAESHEEYVLDIVLYPIVQPVVVEAEEVVEAPVVAEIVAPPVEIRMNNLFFAFNKADLQPESYMEMKRWIKMLKENEHIHLIISGHADNVGEDAYNQKLSERRAQAVADYLVDNEIDAERLVAEGFGESQPVATNDTEEGRQQNRRVQVRIINSAQ